jgi:uncharacterized protein
MFVNRTTELDYLTKVSQEHRARFLIIYGRRRIGKTELLRHFARGVPHLFFSADLSSEQEQLRQFTEQIHRVTGDPFLQSQPFTSWEALLQYLFTHVVEHAPLIIIDEFPYLCAGNAVLPSILQKVWDETGKHVAVFFIVCGSYMSFMEKEVLGNKSPLFGRRTGQMLLEPMTFHDIEAFFPHSSKAERVGMYAVLGGTPAYLQRFAPEKTFEQNIKDEILDKNAMLYSEPRFLLMEELREPSLYFAILKAIAFGRNRLNAIVQETGIRERQTVNKYLSVLKELYMVQREVPITETQPHTSRKGIYRLCDPFFRFWFRYVFPNLSYLEEGDIEYVWRHKILPGLESFIGPIFEQICIQALKQKNRCNALPFKASRIGRWWDRQHEVDIVAYDGESGGTETVGSPTGNYLLCECKWTSKPMSLNVLENLRANAAFFPQAGRIYYGLFSKSGFRDDLRDAAATRDDVLLFDY